MSGAPSCIALPYQLDRPLEFAGPLDGDGSQATARTPLPNSRRFWAVPRPTIPSTQFRPRPLNTSLLKSGLPRKKCQRSHRLLWTPGNTSRCTARRDTEPSPGPCWGVPSSRFSSLRHTRRLVNPSAHSSSGVALIYREGGLLSTKRRRRIQRRRWAWMRGTPKGRKATMAAASARKAPHDQLKPAGLRRKPSTTRARLTPVIKARS
jgi:hypothetical protein